MRTFWRWFVITLVSSVTVPTAAAVTITGALIFLPLPAALPGQAHGLASARESVVLDTHSNQIATFSEFEQSIPVSPQDIPTILKQAVIAVEDRNFYHHGGVDIRSSLRALIRDLRGQSYVQGGSTITQQYVKNAYLNRQRTILRKLQEAVLASQLARQVPKDEILFKYLDSIYFGEGAYGVGAAAETYFHKSVRDLTTGEAALLAGLIPAPSRWEPRGNQVQAEQRRQLVLQKMLEQGYITPEEYGYWKAAQVYLADKPPLPPGAPETLVYPAEQPKFGFPYFVDYLRRYLELAPEVGPDVVYRGGLRIQATIDPDMQAAAEKAVSNTLAGTSPPLEMSLVSVEPQTGFIKAMVGGRGFNTDQTNLTLGGCEHPENPNWQIVVPATCWENNTPLSGGTGRQPGSAFKPFTLAAALNHGVLPTETWYGPNSYTVPGCLGPQCTIHNAESGSYGRINLRQATWYSVNTVYAQLVLDRRVGVARAAQMAKNLGITEAWYSPQRHGASYTLGAIDVSPLDMASAFGVFDNHGVRVPATPVVLVKDASGKTLIDNRLNPTPPRGSRVLDPAVADNVTDILRGVIAGGTGRAADIGRPAAGKTGTTSDFTDAWFIGYVPTLSTAVWMGWKDTEDATKRSLRNVKGYAEVFGGTLPAQTWAAYMRVATKDIPVTDFNQPPPLQPVADAVDEAERHGIDPGEERYPIGVGEGGPYEYGPAPPEAEAPTTTTSSTTTTTTEPGGAGGGPGPTLPVP